MSYTLSQEASDFLLYSYLGITLKEMEDCDRNLIIMKCAQRAYLDLSRTLNFTEKIKEKHQDFRDNICTKIKEQILDNLFKSDAENFDDWHENTCTSIQKEANESTAITKIENKNAKEYKEEEKKFYYGQAQKWLNMTLKYMWLIGLWKEQFDKLLPVLHAPVDSFIIEAIWHEDFKENNKGWIKEVKNWSVKLPCDKEKRKFKYSDDKVVPWSRWNFCQYWDFQTDLRAWCENKSLCPIIWEGQAWIEVAKERSSK